MQNKHQHSPTISLYHFWKIGSDFACFYIKKGVNFLILGGDVILNFRLKPIGWFSLLNFNIPHMILKPIHHLMFLDRFEKISAIQVMILDNSILNARKDILTHFCHVYYFDYWILIFCHSYLYFQCGTYEKCMEKCMIHITNITISNNYIYILYLIRYMTPQKYHHEPKPLYTSSYKHKG